MCGGDSGGDKGVGDGGAGSRLPRPHWGDLLELPRNPPPGPARGLAPTTCTCVGQPLDVKGPDPRLPKAPLREHMSFGHLHAPLSTCPCLQQGCGCHFQIPEPQNPPCLHSDSDPGPGPPGHGAGSPVEGPRCLSHCCYHGSNSGGSSVAFWPRDKPKAPRGRVPLGKYHPGLFIPTPLPQPLASPSSLKGDREAAPVSRRNVDPRPQEGLCGCPQVEPRGGAEGGPSGDVG